MGLWKVDAFCLRQVGIVCSSGIIWAEPPESVLFRRLYLSMKPTPFSGGPTLMEKLDIGFMFACRSTLAQRHIRWIPQLNRNHQCYWSKNSLVSSITLPCPGKGRNPTWFECDWFLLTLFTSSDIYKPIVSWQAYIFITWLNRQKRLNVL